MESRLTVTGVCKRTSSYFASAVSALVADTVTWSVVGEVSLDTVGLSTRQGGWRASEVASSSTK
jgi:hypothetical protein